MVEAGELIKIRYIFYIALQSFGSKPFIVEAGELIKIRYIFIQMQSPDWRVLEPYSSLAKL